MEILVGFVVGLLLGVVVAKLFSKRKDGTIYLRNYGEKKVFTLELNGDPEDLERRRRVTFDVEQIAE